MRVFEGAASARKGRNHCCGRDALTQSSSKLRYSSIVSGGRLVATRSMDEPDAACDAHRAAAEAGAGGIARTALPIALMTPKIRHVSKRRCILALAPPPPAAGWAAHRAGFSPPATQSDPDNPPPRSGMARRVPSRRSLQKSDAFRNPDVSDAGVPVSAGDRMPCPPAVEKAFFRSRGPK